MISPNNIQEDLEQELIFTPAVDFDMMIPQPLRSETDLLRERLERLEEDNEFLFQIILKNQEQKIQYENRITKQVLKFVKQLYVRVNRFSPIESEEKTDENRSGSLGSLEDNFNDLSFDLDQFLREV